MRFLISSIVLLLSLQFYPFADSFTQDLINVTEVPEKGFTPSSIELMTERLRETAIENRPFAPIPRVTHFDFAFGATASEFKKLDGFGVIHITSVNEDPREHPIKRVYLSYHGDDVELIPISYVRVRVEDPFIDEVFGRHRMDYFYLIPYYFMELEGFLMIDWSVNRTEFVMFQLPIDFNLGYEPEFKFPQGADHFDEDAFYQFLDREFNIRFGE